MTEPTRSSYWAFISYTNHDSAAAKKLHQELENYRIPSALAGKMGRDGAVPKRIFPIFYDREELAGASSISDELKNCLRSSRYLIVICSPASTQSRWVAEEITFFKSLGREDHILTYIVSGEPNATSNTTVCSSLECFPESLRFQLNPDGSISNRPAAEPLAADSRPDKDGPKHAFFKIVAAVAGAPLADLTMRESERERRQRAFRFAISASLIFACIIAGFFYWDHIRTRVAYFAAITSRFGIPEGVCQLSQNQLSHRERSWKIETSCGKVRRVQLVHSSGAVKDPFVRSPDENWSDYDASYNPTFQALNAYVPADLESFNAGTIEVSYNENGKPRLWNLVDRNGRKKARMDISDDSHSFTFMHPDHEHPFPLVFGRVGESGQRFSTRITKFHVTYTPDGLVQRIDYFDDYENTQTTSDGIAGMLFNYRENCSLPEQTLLLNPAGEAATATNGISSVRNSYSPLANIVHQTLLDAQGKAVARPDGISITDCEFDSNGNITGASYFSPDTSPADGFGGFARWTLNHTKSGSPEIVKFFDAQGKITNTCDGYTSRSLTSDQSGNITSETFLDSYGHPVISNGTFASRKNVYDSVGNLVHVCFLDPAGLAATVFSSISGFSGYRRELDPLGREVRFTYLDSHDQPTLSNRGYSTTSRHYDRAGKIQRISLLGTLDEPAWYSDGFSTISYSYDPQGFLNEKSYLGTDGNLVNARVDHGGHTHDYARVSYITNERGFNIKEQWFAADGSPAFIHGASSLNFFYYPNGLIRSKIALEFNGDPATYFGVYESRYVYDAAGNETVWGGFGRDGKPALLRGDGWGCFSRVKLRDPQGRIIKDSFFDQDGKPLLTESGYSFWQQSYSPQGKVLSISYFDQAGKPCLDKSGVHQYQSKYDIRGNEIEVSYHAPDGSLASNNQGVARWTKSFDKRNLVVREEIFDAFGHPASILWHIRESDYDTLGHITETRHYGPDGKLRANENGVSIIRYLSRPDGKNIQLRYFDAQNQPTLSNEKIHGVDYSYDTLGNETGRQFLGIDGKPKSVADKAFASFHNKFDSRGRLVESAWFDTAGEPAANGQGVHIVRYKLNSLGRTVQESNHGPNGEPILSEGQWHLKTYSYDAYGNTTEQAYFDVIGNPCTAVTYYTDANGVKEKQIEPHKHVFLFDFLNRPSGFKEFGTDGNPVEVAGFHHVSDTCNSVGNHIVRRYFDKNEKPVENEWGYSKWETDYDPYGREIEKRLFGLDGKLKTSAFGYARYTFRYNELNKVVEQSYFDAVGRPAIFKNLGCARITREYGVSGKLTSETKYDVLGHPLKP